MSRITREYVEPAERPLRQVTVQGRYGNSHKTVVFQDRIGMYIQVHAEGRHESMAIDPADALELAEDIKKLANQRHG